jgi:hypothetical protein
MVTCPSAPSKVPVPPVIAGVGVPEFMLSSKAYSIVPPASRAVPTCVPADPTTQ